jgi:hypothetical protein
MSNEDSELKDKALKDFELHIKSIRAANNKPTPEAKRRYNKKYISTHKEQVNNYIKEYMRKKREAAKN